MEDKFTLPEFDSPKNYPEDYVDGHNQYVCKCYKCKEHFYGYKRRIICKECLNTEDKTLDNFDFLHNKVADIVNNNNTGNNELIELLKSYDNKYSDRGTLRTLLMSIKPILKDNEELKYYYNKLADRLRTGSNSKKI